MQRTAPVLPTISIDQLKRVPLAVARVIKARSVETRKLVLASGAATVSIIAIIAMAAAVINAPVAEDDGMFSEQQEVVSLSQLPAEVPYIKNPDAAHLQFAQTGEPWSWLPYWGENVAWNGCGLCSYTSAIDILTGSDYTPSDMLEIRGDWEGMDAYTDDATGTDGRTHAQWTKDTFGLNTFRVECSMDALAAAVSRGDCVAIVCTHGDVFVDNAGGVEGYDGHFVCVWGMDDNGCFRVHDSALPHGYGTDVRYTPEEMSNMVDYTTSITVYQGTVQS